MTYNVMAVSKDAVKEFVGNVASKFTDEELKSNAVFFRFPMYGKYATECRFEWDRYDFIYSLLESKALAKADDELLAKSSVLFNDCFEVFNIGGICHAIDKLEKLIKFDDDHGPGVELDEEIKKIYGKARMYKYSQESCKALINDLNGIKLVMKDPRKTDGTPANVYWMIYAY